MAATFEMFTKGQFKSERTVGARFLPAIIEVIASLKGISVAAAQTAYRALDDAEKTALKSKFAEECAEIEAARSKASDVDLTDLI